MITVSEKITFDGIGTSKKLRNQTILRNLKLTLFLIVEPIAGVLGAYLVLTVTPILPYALAFAAGAMIFVVVEELIPESQTGNETDLSTIGAMLGFATMMVLDVALG